MLATWVHAQELEHSELSGSTVHLFLTSRFPKARLGRTTTCSHQRSLLPAHYRKRDLTVAAVIQLDVYLRRLVMGKLRFRLH